MFGVRKVKSKGVLIEEVIMQVEAIPKSMVWKVRKVNVSLGLPAKKFRSHFVPKEASW